jgi:Tol biopolymer transport system component
VKGVLPSGPIAWSPDGQTLVFAGTVGVRHTQRSSRTRTMLFAVAAEGGKPRALPGTADAEDPVFSPDGRTIAFARQRFELRLHHPGKSGLPLFESTSTWLTDIGGEPARRLTPWKSELDNTPSSFSPDGLTLALTRATGHGGSEAVGLRLDTGAETLLARNASEPVYSPDGSRIALLRTATPRNARSKGTDLVVIQADGSGEVRLMAASQGTAVSPRWDPSGQRIAFVKLKRHETLESLLTEGDSIFEVNADGTCPYKAFAASHVLYSGAVWQPGPGREAGPLSC